MSTDYELQIHHLTRTAQPRSSADLIANYEKGVSECSDCLLSVDVARVTR